MMQHRRWFGVAALVLITLVFGIPAARAQTGAPTIQPTTPIIAAGKTIRFTGAGFALGERVATWATAPDQTVYSGQFFYAARADGTVDLTFHVPGDAPGGRWGFTAYGDRSKMPAITNFEVQANQASENRPVDTVDPAAGPAGTRFRFNMYGYNDNETISYWITGPDGKVFAAYPRKEKADKRGKVSFSWNAPSDAPHGIWVVTVQGIKSGRAKGLRFEIQ